MSSPNPRVIQQGTHHYILTVQQPPPGEGMAVTRSGNFTPPPGATRADLYETLLRSIFDEHPGMAGGTVTFFALERNEL
jgi:hypothetical protein